METFIVGVHMTSRWPYLCPKIILRELCDRLPLISVKTKQKAAIITWEEMKNNSLFSRDIYLTFRGITFFLTSINAMASLFSGYKLQRLPLVFQ